MKHITAHRSADGHITEVADAMAASFTQECSTCTGLFCLDCADGTEHATCTRRCPTCAADDIDWDQSWQTTALITELAGLDRLDRAVQSG